MPETTKLCAKCNKEIVGIPCRHPVTKKEICQNCYRRSGLNSAIFRPRRMEEQRGGKRRGRKAKYPTRESLIVLLEQREARGEENFPSSVFSEKPYLYILFRRFGIELPRKNRPQTECRPGDKVKNVNFRDRSVQGKIGTVISNGGKEVLVTFGELGGIRRVYKKWYNLNNIVLFKNKSPAC